MSRYLSQRKRAGNPDNLQFYAIIATWDPESKTQKRKQIFLGSKLNGSYRFNSKAIEFADLFNKSEHAQAFSNWQLRDKATKENTALISIEDIATSEMKNSGIGIVLSHIARSIGLTEKLSSVFGADLANRLLALAYYCTKEERGPLSLASLWGQNQKLPGNVKLTEAGILKVLHKISVDDIKTFLTEWLKTSNPDERTLMGITYESNQRTDWEEMFLEYFPEDEDYPQVNLLVVASKKTKLPLWYEQLPEGISDAKTLIGATEDFVQAGITAKEAVLDFDFASKSNLSCLLKNHFKFTIGIPQDESADFREKLITAHKGSKFCESPKTLTFFDDIDIVQIRTCTEQVEIHKSPVFLHTYCVDLAQLMGEEESMTELHEVEENQESDEKTAGPKELGLADIVSLFLGKDAGVFSILSNQFKDPLDALIACKLRIGIQKRFNEPRDDDEPEKPEFHSRHCQQVQLFIQFLSEILRRRIQSLMQSGLTLPENIITVIDLLGAVDAITWIKSKNHPGFYKNPSEFQKTILDALNISWPPPKR